MDNKNPLVSVIIPCYNAEKIVGYTLDSVINQTYKNIEIICVNDCSKDNSLKVLEEFEKKDKRIKVLNNSKNSGVAETRNNALKIAKGEYVAFVDSDDIWHLDKLEKQINFMVENGYDLTFTSVQFIDDNGNLTGTRFIVPKQVTYKQLLKQNVITLSSAVISKKILKDRIFHDDHLHEDFILWLELLNEETDKAYGMTEVLVDYRLTAGSKTRNKWKSLKMTYKTYKHFHINWIKAHYYLFHYIIRGLRKYKKGRNDNDENREDRRK